VLANAPPDLQTHGQPHPRGTVALSSVRENVVAEAVLTNAGLARLGRRAKGKPGDLHAAKCRTWAVLLEAFEAIGTATDSEDRRKWGLAYSQVLGISGPLLSPLIL
jgi:hypothetical protein